MICERHGLAGKKQAQRLWLYATAQAQRRRQTVRAAAKRGYRKT